MRRSLFRPVLALALFLALGPAWVPLASQPAGATVQAPGYAALIGDFPRPGTDGAKADLAILLWLQRTRTREDILRAESEVIPHLGIFSAVTGRDLESSHFPLTQALAAEAMHDLRRATGALKEQYARPRPYDASPDIHPAVAREPTFSYPSGHSAWGMVEAELLATLQPRAAEAILARGRQVGYDRCLGGVHYPSDVDAGQRVGMAFGQDWLAEPGRRLRLEQARAEW